MMRDAAAAAAGDHLILDDLQALRPWARRDENDENLDEEEEGQTPMIVRERCVV